MTVEEIPELVRVFLFGPVDANKGQHGRNRRNRNMNTFDYISATDFLKKHPDQVEYVTFECEAPRRDRYNDDSRGVSPSRMSKEGDGDSDSDILSSANIHYDDLSNILAATGNKNPFLHSPLRWACIEIDATREAMEFLLTIRMINPTVFLIQDRHGDLPIDGECVLNASPELLSFLLEIYLEFNFECLDGVRMTENNFNPITCLCGSYWWEDIRRANEDILSGDYTVKGKNVLEDNLGIEDNFWKKINLLAKAFYHNTIKDIDEECNEKHPQDHQENFTSSPPSKLRIVNKYVNRTVEFRLLHACAGIDWFPPNLLRLLVTAFPGALLEPDEDGNLPIHVAAGSCFSSYKMHDYCDNDSWLSDFEANSGYQKTTIDILLHANPLLAQMKDRKGRLPLELAIENNINEIEGLDSDLHKSVQYKNMHERWRPWEDGGIGSILEAYPDASKIRSPVTGKLPLEMTLSSGSYRDWNDGVEALLRVYPEAAALKNPKTGKYPVQLAIERDTHFDEGVYGLLELAPEAALERPRGDLSPRASLTSVPSQLPLFAHAASENCSASVIYKLLRMNPQYCATRQCFEQPKMISSNRKRRRDENESMVSFPMVSSSGGSPSKIRRSITFSAWGIYTGRRK